MAKEVAGINLETLEDPIRVALKGYESVSNGDLMFDARNAAQLTPTPDKPNSARSESAVLYKGKGIGKLYVIAFKPGDGSGDESGNKLEDLEVDPPYPRTTRVVPRNKTGVDSEGHLTILTHKIDDAHPDPELYEGRFDLLGLEGKTIKKNGELGQKSEIKLENMHPLTTLTVGTGQNCERFGDPHAVYSSRPETLQVCAFLAISDEMYADYGDILASLYPKEPR